MRVGHEGPQVYHLLFVDDLLYAKATIKQAYCIKKYLDQFC